MFWRRKRKPEPEPEPEPIVVSERTIALYELVQDMLEYPCQSQAVIYGPDGTEYQCGGCRSCDSYEDPDMMKMLKTGLNRRLAGDSETEVQQIYWHPAFRRILKSLRGLNGKARGERRHFYNVLFYIGTHSDEVLEWMSKTPEQREALKKARAEQEQLAAQKAQNTEE